MKFCLAGTAANREIIEKYTPKFILESFYYFQDWQIPLLKKCELFLLDSGAFTFMNNFKGTVDWDDYVKRYADFINKYDVKYFFELDIDVLVGLEEVKRLRKKLERLTNKKCIPVWHKTRGLDEWKDIISNYDYVAIGGIVIREIPSSEYKYFRPLLKMAEKHNCKVHGLGFTATRDLKYYHFYSIDSTSWTSASRFAQISMFDGEKIRNVPKPKNSRMKNCKKALEISLKEWLKFQDYADKYL